MIRANATALIAGKDASHVAMTPGVRSGLTPLPARVSPKSCLGAGAINSNLGLSCNDFLASR
jgi:hypothetical protein